VAHETSAEQMRAQAIEAMGPDAGALYYLLWQELARLHATWGHFTTLFTGTKNIALLNATAPRFFADLQSMQFQHVMLHLCRLTDPAKSAGKSTVTVRALAKHFLGSLASEVRSMASTAVDKTQFARDWRNRRLAHSDLERALNPTLRPLAPASRAHVEDAMAALRAVLNHVETATLGTTTAFQAIVASGGGPRALIYHLQHGLDVENARRQRMFQKASQQT
jgi:hypothetical protein